MNQHLKSWTYTSHYAINLGLFLDIAFQGLIAYGIRLLRNIKRKSLPTLKEPNTKRVFVEKILFETY